MIDSKTILRTVECYNHIWELYPFWIKLFATNISYIRLVQHLIQFFNFVYAFGREEIHIFPIPPLP